MASLKADASSSTAARCLCCCGPSTMAGMHASTHQQLCVQADLDISSQDIVLGDSLGSGAFGSVYRGAPAC